MINQWTERSLDIIRDELKAAIKAVTDKHGLMPMAGMNIKYTANRITVKFDLSVNPANFVAPTKTGASNHEAEILNNLGVPLGTKLRSNKYGICTVVGYNGRSRKFPIVTQNSAGQQIKFSNYGVRNQVTEYPAGYTPNPALAMQDGLRGIRF